MRIIKDTTKCMHVTCKKCDSQLELNPTDVHGGDVCNFFYICPVCKQTNFIQTKDIPKPFLNHLDI